MDVEAVKSFPSNEKIIIQVKRLAEENKIGSKIIREYATLYQQIPDADEVVIVTTSDVTSPAERLAKDLDVKIFVGSEISEHIAQSKIDMSNYFESDNDERSKNKESKSTKERESKNKESKSTKERESKNKESKSTKERLDKKLKKAAKNKSRLFNTKFDVEDDISRQVAIKYTTQSTSSNVRGVEISFSGLKDISKTSSGDDDVLSLLTSKNSIYEAKKRDWDISIIIEKDDFKNVEDELSVIEKMISETKISWDLLEGLSKRSGLDVKHLE